VLLVALCAALALDFEENLEAQIKYKEKNVA
jgi:hypothetical protein